VSAPGYETKVLSISVHPSRITRSNLTMTTQMDAFQIMKHGNRVATPGTDQSDSLLYHGMPRNAFIMLISKYIEIMLMKLTQ